MCCEGFPLEFMAIALAFVRRLKTRGRSVCGLPGRQTPTAALCSNISCTVAVLNSTTRWCTLFSAGPPEKASRTLLKYGALRKVNKNKEENQHQYHNTWGISLKLWCPFPPPDAGHAELENNISVIFFTPFLLSNSKYLNWTKSISDSLAICGNLLLNFILRC